MPQVRSAAPPMKLHGALWALLLCTCVSAVKIAPAKKLPAAKAPQGKGAVAGFNTFDYGYTATFSDGQTDGGGSCGYGTAEESGFGVNTISASQALYRKGLNCGACFRLQCTGSQLCLPRPTPVLTVTNACPPNGPGGWCNGQKKSYTLAPAVWNHIATNPNLAVVPVRVQRVACPRVGGVTFKVVQGQAFYFTPFWAVLISNVGGSGDLLEVQVKLTGSYWRRMRHSYGAVWGLDGLEATSQNPGTQGSFSFKLTTAYFKETIVINNAVPAVYSQEMVYNTNVNFKLGKLPPRKALEEAFNATMIVH